jgi:hypothetical protein
MDAKSIAKAVAELVSASPTHTARPKLKISTGGSAS